MKRKITSILAADVADFSRLVAEDEEDTLARLVAAQDVFKTHIVSHGGRIFNTAGDAILAEFASAVEAVRAATSIQAQLKTDNTDYVNSRRLAFRMGVSIGDVVEHGDDLLGDGVNIAARLQGLAPAGGIAVSNWVHEQIAGKVDLPFRDIGRQALKNIPGAVQVYVSDHPAEPNAIRGTAKDQQAASRPTTLSPIYAVVAGLVFFLGFGGYLAQRAPRAPTETAVVALPSVAMPETSTQPASPVLPYPNLPEPAPPGPPSSSGSPESDRPPATPVVLQPLPPLPTSLPRGQPTDDTTTAPPPSPPPTPLPVSTPPTATPPPPTRTFIPLPQVSPLPAPVQPVTLPSTPTPAVVAPAKSEPTFTLASPPKPIATPSLPALSDPSVSPQKIPPVASPSAPLKKQPTAAASPKKDADPRRRAQLCREIVERVQMGETLAADDRDFLRTQCS